MSELLTHVQKNQRPDSVIGGLAVQWAEEVGFGKLPKPRLLSSTALLLGKNLDRKWQHRVPGDRS